MKLDPNKGANNREGLPYFPMQNEIMLTFLDASERKLKGVKLSLKLRAVPTSLQISAPAVLSSSKTFDSERREGIDL